MNKEEPETLAELLKRCDPQKLIAAFLEALDLPFDAKSVMREPQ